jgi:hypothetical protein
MTPLRWDKIRELLGRTTLVGQYNLFSDEPATELSILKLAKPEREWLEDAVDTTLPLF